MYLKLKHLIIQIIEVTSLVILLVNNSPAIAARFTSNYPCSDIAKTCLSSGSRIIDGFSVYRACWEYSYKKTCNYLSKDNCRLYGHCYAVADLPCLLYDSLGNCVNLQKEFSCKSWMPAEVENKKAKMGLTEKDGEEGLVCSGIPCIDGNCVDKSYETNGEMMDSISKLYMISQMKDAKDLNFQIFEGLSQHCSKKATNYTNCCSVSLKGWGNTLGARCNNDEKQLIENRKKKLCVYVGKENKGVLKTVVKHHYCCFGNLLQKVVQVEGRKQLYAKGLMNAIDKNFGSGGRTNCRGLTLAELQNLDFDTMDLTEFIEDFKVKFAGRYKAPNIDDISARAQGAATSNIKKGDDNPSNKENNKSGWSNKIVVED